MVERICPACQHANPLDNRYCGACGTGLEQQALVRRQPDAIVIAGQAIPVAQIKQVGRAVAVGVAAVVAEAGLAWLRRRTGTSTALATRPAQTSLAPHTADPAASVAANVVTIISQRVVEIWDEGSLTRQVVERHVWRKEG